MDETKDPGIKIAQIFLARARFDHATNAAALPPSTPVGNIKTSVAVNVAMNDEETAGMVSVTVASTPDSEGLYSFDVEMIAIVELLPNANMPIRQYLKQSGPPTLYPFIRETVASLSAKGRFGPVWIPPMNFAAIAEGLVFKDEGEGRKKKPRAE
jgi:preprotein translocase subunit SecB